MTTRNHPRIWPRGTTRAAAVDPTLIAVVYAPASHVATWVEAELDRAGARVQVARSMRALVKALIEDPSPRPHVLVVDLDSVSPAELMELHSLRQLGWFGSFVGLGRVPGALRTSLCLDRALAPPFVHDQLCDTVADLRAPQPTVRIPVLRDLAPV